MDELVENWVEQQFAAAQCAIDAGGRFDAAAHLQRSFADATALFEPTIAADAHLRLQQRLAAYDRVVGALRALQGDGDDRGRPRSGVPGFVIEGTIGRGGMGRVFRARHVRLGRTVAVKVPLFGSSLSERDRSRLVREAHAAARLDHPGIVRLLETDTYEGAPCLVMEFVDGRALAEVLAQVRAGETTLGATIRRPELDHVQAACEVARQLLEAIDAAHLAGVVHRDLKPSNVMIESTGRVRILDFGLARLDGDNPVTKTGEMVGTPQYLPPEQLAHCRGLIGPWTDTFGIGVILFEMLALRHPFEAPTAEQTIARIRAGDATPLRRVAREVPVAVACVVEKSLSPDPRARYATANECLLDLARAVDDGRPLARPVTTLTRWWRRVRRRPALAAAVAVSVAVTIAAAAIGVIGEREQQRTHDDLVVSTLERATAALDAGEVRRAQDVLVAADALISSPRTSAAAREHHRSLGAAAALADRLEAIGSRGDLASVRDGYRAFFMEQYGEIDAAALARITAALRALPHREWIVQALHDWGLLATPSEQRLIRPLVAGVDRDPVRQRIIAAFAARDREQLVQIGQELEATRAGWHVSALLATALESVGDVQTAEAVLARATLRFPNRVLLHVHLADLLGRHAAGQRAASIRAALETAAALRPEDGAIHARLVETLVQQREYDLALAAARAAVERLPNDYLALRALAEAHAAREDTELALAALRDAEAVATTARDRIELQRRRGYVLHHARRIDESLAAYEQVLAAEPRDLHALRQVVLLCMIDGRDMARARELLPKGLALAPDDCYLLEFQSNLAAASGDYAVALRCIERIMVLDPSYYRDLYTQLWSAADVALSASRAPGVADDERARLRRTALGWAEQSVHHATRAMFTNEASAPAWSKRAREWLRARPGSGSLAALGNPDELAGLPADEAEWVQRILERAVTFAAVEEAR